MNAQKSILAAMLLLLPVMVSAQAEDFLPAIRVDYPGIDLDAATYVPSTVNIDYLGHDPDEVSGPTHVRFMLIQAEAGGQPVSTRLQYENHAHELIDWSRWEWSPWIPYAQDPGQRRITFPDLPDQEYFLFAIQAMDTTGAVSLGRGYGQEVFNFQVRPELFRPQVTLSEYYLGTVNADSYAEIASGQPLNFSWMASAEGYNGEIVSYRHGFDIVDPEDPNDPGWLVPPGTAPENFYAEERTFNSGYHTFTLRVEDDAGQVTEITWDLAVIPFVSPPYQLPLLVIDQVVDSFSNQWPDATGLPRDREEYRNAYWQFLEGAEGVAGFSWDQDRFDHTQPVSLSDLVQYRNVLIYARTHSAQLMFSEFRPQNGVDRYVWLTAYQERGGNLFLVGDRSQDGLLEILPNYMVPLIFESTQEFYEVGGETYVTGFGETTLPDGTDVMRGPRMYSYAAAGISSLDWTVPLNKYIYGRTVPGHFDRKAQCAGVKGLVLDPGFKAHHLIGPGVLPDTLLTNPVIDWRDGYSASSDSLDVPFPFYGDEFVDFNISPSTTPIIPQECPDGPDGLCVEPMFQSLARFDWLRERKWAEGDEEWPQSQYSQYRLEEICGPMALTAYDDGGETIPNGTARTNERTVGFFSYKNIQDKPNPRANVYWGFDPYRFDPEASRQAVRWVLEYFGIQFNN